MSSLTDYKAPFDPYDYLPDNKRDIDREPLYVMISVLLEEALAHEELPPNLKLHPLIKNIMQGFDDEEAVRAYFNTMILHRLGMRHTVTRMFNLLGVKGDITEWFNNDIPIIPYKFFVELYEFPTIPIPDLVNLIIKVKNERSHLLGLRSNDKTICPGYFILDQSEQDSLEFLTDAKGEVVNGIKICFDFKFTHGPAAPIILSPQILGDEIYSTYTTPSPYATSAVSIDFVNDTSRTSTGRAGNSALMLTCQRSGAAYFDNPETGEWFSVPANTIRRDSRGLLVERPSSNIIKNNSMQGAVVGTPGTLPTSWTAPASIPGLTLSVVNKGVEKGVDFIDIRINGTAGTTTSTILYFDSSTGAGPATQNQIWSSSAFFKLVSGSLGPVTNLYLSIAEFSAASIFLGQSWLSNLKDLTDTLTRRAYRTSLAQATTAKVSAGVYLSVTNGSVIDFTLRIGWPQLEFSPFTTSPIRTTGSLSGRAGERIYLEDPSVIQNGTCTLYTRFKLNNSAADRTNAPNDAVPICWAKDTTTYQNILVHRNSNVYGENVNNNISDFGPATGVGTITDTLSHSVGLAIGPNNGVINKDGVMSTIDSVVMPATGPATSVTFGSTPFAQVHPIDGFVQAVAIWKERVTDAELQLIVTSGMEEV